MLRLLQLFGKWQGFKGGLARMPLWARLLVGLAAIPGIVLVLLSIAAFLVSLLALFLLTTPVYRLVAWLTGSSISRTTPVYEYYTPEEDAIEIEVPSGPGDAPADVPVAIDPVCDAAGAPQEIPQQRPRRQIEVKIVE